MPVCTFENADILLSIIALLLSLISAIALITSLFMQRNHNRKTVRPIAHISFSDYENLLSVKLFNRGSGPMIIKKLTVEKEEAITNNIIELMPELPRNMTWSTFVKDIDGFAILPSESINLIEFQVDQMTASMEEARDGVRKALSELTVSVEYTDVYNSKIPIRERSLDWFGRHFII